MRHAVFAALVVLALDAMDALDEAPRSAAPARLTLFLSLDAPDGDRALYAARAFQRSHPEVVFEPVLLADLALLGRMQDDPELARRMQALSVTGESFPMVGTVPLARRFGITEVPAFVLEVGPRAHRIAGVPDLEAFYRRTAR